MNARKHQTFTFLFVLIKVCEYMCVNFFFFFGEEHVCIFVYEEKGMQWLILNSLNN